MLSREFWRKLQGSLLDDRVRVGSLLRADRDGMFAAEAVQPGDFGGARIVALFIRASAQPVMERYLEASFLDHPNLLRCFGAGTYQFHERQFVYAILERPDSTLADVSNARSLSPGEIRDVGLQLIDGLNYLHENNLIYCDLDATAVSRVRDTWKLSDYSGLRVPGDHYAEETRPMLTAAAATPPEAGKGIVGPAWDAWSLAWLVGVMATKRRPGARPSSEQIPVRRDLSPPFSTIIGECLNANPAERCRLDRIGELLQQIAAPRAAAAEPPPRQPEFAARQPERAAPEPVAAARQSIPPEAAPASEPGSKWSDRLLTLTPQQAMLTAGAVLAVFIAVAMLVFPPNRSAKQRAPTTRAASVATTTPVAAPPPPVEPVSAENDETATRSEEAGPRALLNRWADALRAGNVEDEVGCYAPRVYAFFSARDLTPQDIRVRRQQALDRFKTLRKYDIKNVEVENRGPNSAVVTFDGEWEFRGNTSTTGKARERLSMRRGSNGWRITSESNVKTYYKNGQNPLS